MVHSNQVSWRSDARANVVMLFSLFMVPIALAVGLTVDSSQQASSTASLKSITDKAALAGATAMQQAQVTETIVEATAMTAFLEQIETNHDHLIYAPPIVESDLYEGAVIVDVECLVPTVLGAGISGRNQNAISVSSEAKAEFTRNARRFISAGLVK